MPKASASANTTPARMIRKLSRTMSPPMLIWSSAISTTKTMIAYCASLPRRSASWMPAVAAVGDDGVADEAREVRAEGEDQQRHDHLGHEQHQAPEQVGDVGEARGR